MPLGQLDSYCIGSLLALNIKDTNNDLRYAIHDIMKGLFGIIDCIASVSFVNTMGLERLISSFKTLIIMQIILFLLIFIFLSLLFLHDFLGYACTRRPKTAINNPVIIKLGGLMPYTYFTIL